MSNNDRFRKVGGSLDSQKWNPQMNEANGFKLGTDNVREGYYLGANELPSKAEYGDKPFLVHIIKEMKEGDVVGTTWGTPGDTILNEKLLQCKIGDYIRLEYTGRRLKKTVAQGTPIYKSNSYHTWELGVDDNAVPYAQAVKSVGVDETFRGETRAEKPLAEKPVDVPAQNPAPTFDEDDSLPF